MTEEPAATEAKPEPSSPRSWWRRATWWLRAVAIANVLALVGFRLWTDADDFNNWDLISFLNANSFDSLGELLRLDEVHFLNPFRFPGYNTGAESVVSILVHRAMSGISLYWSNTVVIVIYDVLVLVLIGALFRVVYRDEFTEAAAWLLAGMSTVFLTFQAVLAFDVQGFATIVAGILGCELILQSRPRAGVALVAFAFLWISQAYPLTFFLPLFCLVWIAVRVTMAVANPPGEHDLEANLRLAVLAVLVGVLVVEIGSLGAYLGKAFGVIGGPLDAHRSETTPTLTERVAFFFHEAFTPDGTGYSPWPGFAPYFVWAALVVAAVAAFGVRHATVPAVSGPAPETGLRALRRRLPVPDLVLVWAAWAGLIFFGYMPSLFGNSLKSQRCFFGDVFLVMAVASAAGWLVRRGIHRCAVAAVLLVLLAGANVTYVQSVRAYDHKSIHRPIFDYDRTDGDARHDLDDTVDYIRRQVRWSNAGLLVYYPRGRNENATDPAMFFARMLRRLGPFHRDDWIFPCHFCEPRYGCPFPDVLRRGCRKKCCYFDPVKKIHATPSLAGRKIYFWWYDDKELGDIPRRNRVLAQLKRDYKAADLGTPTMDKRWTLFELTPRKVKKQAPQAESKSGT